MDILEIGKYTNTSLCDILEANIDMSELKEVAESKMEFNGTHEIVLYTSLNKTNMEALINRTYQNTIIAFEYYEMALKVEQAECIAKIAYDIRGLYDTLHPNAFKEIESIINNRKLKKVDIGDAEIIRLLMKAYPQRTGFRIHSVKGKKVTSKSNIVFETSRLTYLLKPSAVKVLDVQSKE